MAFPGNNTPLVVQALIHGRWLLLPLAILLSACHYAEDEKMGCTDPRALNYEPDAVYDSGECEYSDSYRYYMPHNWDEPDEKGNLMVVNQTGSPLHLYAEGAHLKVIPPSANDFLVDVPVKSDVTDLFLCKAEDIDHVEEPSENIFRNWRVLLEPTANEKDPKVWGVSNQETGEGDGKIHLSYASTKEDENQLPVNADVFLFSKEGGRVTSVEPETEDKVLFLSFGNYIFWFQYWVSDPSSPEGTRILGWRESTDLVLNADKPARALEIPPFDLVPDEAAALNVFNRVGKTINVRLGDRLIENLLLGRENTQALSTITDRDSMLYPVDPGRYLLNFRDLEENEIDEGFHIDLEQNFTARVMAGKPRKSIMVKNQTGEKVFLGTSHYTGISVDGHDSQERSLPATEDPLFAFSEDSTFFREVKISSDTLVISGE